MRYPHRYPPLPDENGMLIMPIHKGILFSCGYRWYVPRGEDFIDDVEASPHFRTLDDAKSYIDERIAKGG